MIARSLPPLLGMLIVASAIPYQVKAQQRLAGQCPLLVPADRSELQPLRIAPSQVAAKNARGCLIYGADGCPLRLCGQSQGSVPLPTGVGLSGSKLQLPEP